MFLYEGIKEVSQNLYFMTGYGWRQITEPRLRFCTWADDGKDLIYIYGQNGWRNDRKFAPLQVGMRKQVVPPISSDKKCIHNTCPYENMVHKYNYIWKDLL